MSNKNYLFFFIILCFLVSIDSFSQEKSHLLFGKIIDENGMPISEANILDNINNVSTSSDENGYFKLYLNNDNFYYLIISHISYETKKIKVTHGQNNLQIKMVYSYTDMPEITVNQKNYNTLKEKLDFLNQKNRNPSLNNSIESLLVTMGGVNSNNELSNQYNVRGGNYDENVIYINGIEVRKPFLVRNAQQEGLSFINPLMINKIDFSRGGFTAEYGDKMSSVLDVGYKKPMNKVEGTINASLIESGVYLGTSNKVFSSVSSFRYKTTSNILKTTDIKGEYKPNYNNIQTFMTFDLSDRFQLFLMGNYDRNEFEMLPHDRETKFGTIDNPKTYFIKYNGKELDNYATYQGSLGFKYQPLSNLDLSFSSTFFGSKESEKLDILSNYELVGYSNTINNSNGSYQEYFRNRLTSYINSYNHTGSLYLDANQIKWGLEIDHENINDHIQEWKNNIDGLNKTDESLTLNQSIYSNNSIKTNRYSGYIQNTYRLQTDNGNWTLNVGARFSHWDFNNENILSPRGTIAYIPAKDNLVFRLSGGIYYQAPLYKEIQKLSLVEDGLYTYKLNDKIKSQKSLHVIIGNDFYFKSGDNKLKLTTELYYKKLSNINPYTIDNQRLYYLGENIGKGYIAGFDIRLFGEFIKDVDSWISLSLMKTNQKFNELSLPLSSDQLYNISFYLQDYMPGYERLSVSLRGVFADGLPFYNAPLKFNSNFLRFPAYRRIDLGFNWHLLGENFPIRNKNSFLSAMKNITLGLDFINILNIKNTNNYYWIADNSGVQYAVPNYLTGRMINLKLEISF